MFFCFVSNVSLQSNYCRGVRLFSFKLNIKTFTFPSCVAPTYLDVHDLGDFPQVNEKADEDADLDNEVGFVVQDVQKHDQRLKDSKYDGTHREAFERLPAVPELDI